MPQVTLNVNNTPYSLACSEGEEQQLQELGAIISQRVGEIASAMGQIGEAKLILMAALLLLDEAKAENAEAALAAKDDVANLQVIKAAAEKIEGIAERIETA